MKKKTLNLFRLSESKKTYSAIKKKMGDRAQSLFERLVLKSLFPKKQAYLYYFMVRTLRLELRFVEPETRKLLKSVMKKKNLKTMREAALAVMSDFIKLRERNKRLIEIFAVERAKLENLGSGDFPFIHHKFLGILTMFKGFYTSFEYTVKDILKDEPKISGKAKH